MFSKSRVSEPGAQPDPYRSPDAPAPSAPAPGAPAGGYGAPARRSGPSVLSSDLIVTGNIRTQGDVQIEGQIEGDIRAHQLTVGETATIKGEIVADDIVVNGRVIGRVRGIKVRLSATARVEGDIVHKTIAIESGAHFEGSVQRQEDPLAGSGAPRLAPPLADEPEDDVSA